MLKRSIFYIYLVFKVVNSQLLMKKALFLLLFLATVVVFSQENKTCDSPEESLEDLNSIAKCTIEPSKKSKDKRARQISVRVSVSKAKRRFLKKRTAEKKAVATSGVNGLSASSVSSSNLNSELLEPLTLKSNLASITNKLSADEVRKADKFTTVDKIPTFSACKKAKKGERMDCFNTEMIKHIQKHFNYPNEAVIKKIEGDVWVRFIIDKNGEVSNIKTLGPKNAQILDEEAKRVVSLLPKFVPADKKGDRVAVKYGFPISFYLED